MRSSRSQFGILFAAAFVGSQVSATYATPSILDAANVDILSPLTVHAQTDVYHYHDPYDLNTYNDVINNFGTNQPAYTNGDTTGDGTVGLSDYNDVINFFDAGVSAGELENPAVQLATVAIPEPTSVALLTTACLSAISFRRRRRR